ncbi:MAG: peptidylprolyl isomerase [Cyanobacteria bacterium P01_H01_bin.121]
MLKNRFQIALKCREFSSQKAALEQLWSYMAQTAGLAVQGLRASLSSVKATAAALVLVAFLILIGTPPAAAGLPPGNAIKDGRALLRYALPLQDEDIRDVQSAIESTSDSLRAKRWSPILKNAKRADRILKLHERKIIDIASVEAGRSQAEQIVQAIHTQIQALAAAAQEKDKPLASEERLKALKLIGTLEGYMVSKEDVTIPAEYADLPYLNGRATIEMRTEKGDLTLIVDGYNAPITAGNFVDLVQRGFYDGLPINRTEEFYIAQLGDPEGPEEGFVDPATGEYRSIPLEIKLKGDDDPIYGFTLESLGLYQEETVLPFSAYGTLGMARPGNDPDGGSSQFFFFLYEPELTPAGSNLIDGRYASFGYVVEGQATLENLKVGDRVIKAEVIEGLENLVEPASLS